MVKRGVEPCFCTLFLLILLRISGSQNYLQRKYHSSQGLRGGRCDIEAQKPILISISRQCYTLNRSKLVSPFCFRYALHPDTILDFSLLNYLFTYSCLGPNLVSYPIEVAEVVSCKTLLYICSLCTPPYVSLPRARSFLRTLHFRLLLDLILLSSSSPSLPRQHLASSSTL